MPASKKRCSACGRTKSLSEFWAQRRDNGYQSRCKQCSKAAVKVWFTTNPTAASRHKRAAYARDPATPILAQIRRRSAAANMPCDLTVDYVRNLLKRTLVCPALGIRLQHKLNGHQDGPRPNSPSLDRFKAELGYVVGN